MDQTDVASEHLQVIRTLMERSALYRRALAPIMLVAGGIGLAASVVACFVAVESNREFGMYWLSVGVLAVIAGLLLVRRQALKDAEPFWSLPTRRVCQAALPAFLMGLVIGVLYASGPKALPESAWVLTAVWMGCYGCGLQAAGAFVTRGMRLFGWIFIVCGLSLVFLALGIPRLQTAEGAHYVMGLCFGALHLAYGVYLYFTESKQRA